MTKEQLDNAYKAIQSGKGLAIKPTKTQVGGFLLILLSALGSALLGKLLGGKGMQFPIARGGAMRFPLVPYRPPPLYCYGNSNGKKKVGKGSTFRKKQSTKRDTDN